MSAVGRTLVGCLVLVCSSQIGLAQVMPPGGLPSPGGTVSKPRSAALTAPKGTREAHEGSTLTLKWTQYLNSPQGHPPAEHFVICLYDPAVKKCSTTPLRWMRRANEIPRVASGSFGYDYTFDLPTALDATQLDRPLQWEVGACATTEKMSCAFATAHVWLSTKNVRSAGGALYVQNNPFGSREMQAAGASVDRSSTDSGTFRYRTELLRAVSTDQGTCETDVTSAYDAGLADTALTWSGEELNLATLPRRTDGTIDVGDRYTSRTPLMPYAAGAYAVLHSVDLNADIAEYDETDNRTGSCWELPELPVPTPQPDMLLTVEIRNPSIEVVVQSQPTGLLCTLFNASNCSESYPFGTLLTLSVHGPFTGWSGCDREYGGYCEVTLNSARHVIAEFRPADSLPSPQP
jgi:hypothetical protein